MSKDFDHDYSGYAKMGHNNNPTQEIIELAQKQYALEKALSKAEDLVKETKEKLREVSEQLLPEKMAELGLAEFSTDDGLRIKVTEKISANISAERKPAATKWLEDNGYGALLKSQVTIPFGRDEIQQANELVESLQQEGREAVLDRSVHTQTLGAFVREQLSEGKDIPLELFGVFQKKISKITIK